MSETTHGKGKKQELSKIIPGDPKRSPTRRMEDSASSAPNMEDGGSAFGKHQKNTFRAVYGLDESHCTWALLQQGATSELRESLMCVGESAAKQRDHGAPSTQSESIRFQVGSDARCPNIACKTEGSDTPTFNEVCEDWQHNSKNAGRSQRLVEMEYDPERVTSHSQIVFAWQGRLS